MRELPRKLLVVNVDLLESQREGECASDGRRTMTTPSAAGTETFWNLEI